MDHPAVPTATQLRDARDRLGLLPHQLAEKYQMPEQDILELMDEAEGGGTDDEL